MKILFQIQGPGQANYTGVWSTLGKMWKEEGWRGFMRGNGTNCVRIVPYSACQFAAYTTYKRVRLFFAQSSPGGSFYLLLAIHPWFAVLCAVVGTFLLLDIFDDSS